jgi:hypothetical protein
MIARLQTYLDLLASLCRTAVAVAAPGLFDLLMALLLSGLALYAVCALLRALRGRDDAESERIKRTILDD